MLPYAEYAVSFETIPESENLMRWEVLKRFELELARENIDFSSCLIVGGTPQDPEYQLIKSLNSSTVE